MTMQSAPTTPAAAATTSATAPASSQKKKIGIHSIKSGRPPQPIRAIVYGPEGVGKSTFGAHSPDPVFVIPEDGLVNIDVPHFEPKSWEELKEFIFSLINDEHDRKTVVFDTVDWLEPLCQQYVCRINDKSDIDAFGYGRGHVAALEEWRKFISWLELLRRAKNMNIVILGHSQVKTFKNPIGEDFDRYCLKINDKAAGLFKEWVDVVLFATHETFAVKKTDKAKAKGVSNGARVMYTQRHAGYDAKTRYPLPPKIALDWSVFWGAVKAPGIDEMTALRKELINLIPQVADESKRKAIGEWLADESLTVEDLRLGLNRVMSVMVEEKEEGENE